MRDYIKCELCPRRCGINRTEKRGFCGQSDKIRIARAAPHFWEEPPISGERGSGAVFFSGCQLRCVFCQNFEVSYFGKGYEVSEAELQDIFLKLRDDGAENINLVSPTPFLPSVIRALEVVKPRLGIPVVMNSGGYESVETLERLNGIIDVYLPDLKYFSPELSMKYSGAPDYFERAMPAIIKMISQTGDPHFSERGILLKGTMVRHLLLPGCRQDSIEVIKALSRTFRPNEILVSLMRQYTPMYRASEFKELGRRVSTFEYNTVLSVLQSTGFDGYIQEAASATDSYTPEFYGEINY